MAFISLNSDKQNKLNKKQGENSSIINCAKEIIQNIFREEEFANIRPLFLKNRTLTIACNNQNIAQEILEHQEEIVDKINDKLGKKEVDRIRYLL